MQAAYHTIVYRDSTQENGFQQSFVNIDNLWTVSHLWGAYKWTSRRWVCWCGLSFFTARACGVAKGRGSRGNCPPKDWTTTKLLGQYSCWTSLKMIFLSTRSVLWPRIFRKCASRCLGRRCGLSTWQRTVASCLTALGALYGQLTFRLAWCQEHTAVTSTELLQSLDLTCGTLFLSSGAIQTSAMGCLDDSWRDICLVNHERGALWLLDMWCLRKTLTYLLSPLGSLRRSPDSLVG